MNNLFKVFAFTASLTAIIACNNAEQTPIANAKTVKFKVFGNCEQCKATIEKSLKIDGVGKTMWDEDSKMLTAEFDSVKLKETSLHHAIALSGYDTEVEKAPEDAYKALPECCQYTRK